MLTHFLIGLNSLTGTLSIHFLIGLNSLTGVDDWTVCGKYILHGSESTSHDMSALIGERQQLPSAARGSPDIVMFRSVTD